MKYFLHSVLVLISFSQVALGFRVVHYNIRELDSSKLKSGAALEQLQRAIEITQSLEPDILSINEMQYDYPAVPNKTFTTKGKNLELLRNLLGKKMKNHFVHFAPANTGMKAKPLPDGTFATDPRHPKWKELVDHTNFGIFPAQYSTGALSPFPIVKSKVIDALEWQRFHSGLDLSMYKNAIGGSFPKNMQLFDKNFSDIVLRSGKKTFHLILLHTVPAYNFGNKNGLNIKRNGDQLAFLEWYLTGKTSQVPVGSNVGTKPLPPGTPFIAVGDFNTDITHTSNPGSEVLRRLGKKFIYWSAPKKTYEGSGFAPAPFRTQFDYILVSSHFKVSKGEVYWPADKRKELGCDDKQVPIPAGFVKVAYEKDSKKCWALVSKKYHDAKVASDHFPIWADIEWK